MTPMKKSVRNKTSLLGSSEVSSLELAQEWAMVAQADMEFVEFQDLHLDQ